MGGREQGGREVGVSVPLVSLTRYEGGEGEAGGVNREGDRGDTPRAKGRGGRARGAGNPEEGGVLDPLYPLSERERGRRGGGREPGGTGTTLLAPRRGRSERGRVHGNRDGGADSAETGAGTDGGADDRYVCFSHVSFLIW